MADALGIPGLDAAIVEVINRVVPHNYHGLATTFSLTHEQVARTSFYPLGVPDTSSAVLPQRVADFYAAAPEPTGDEMRVLGWSSGPGSGTYIKVEKSYSGSMADSLISVARRQTCDEREVDNLLRATGLR